MDLWIIATLLAALFQTGRFALQKRLTQAGLSFVGATWARFLWSVPLIWIGLLGSLMVSGRGLPDLSLAFWGYAVMGGVSQILATVAVVALFSMRNFAVGITLKKTEVLQTALVGWVILGETVSPMGLGALLLGLGALLLLSDIKGIEDLRGLSGRAMGIGLLSGAFFACAGVGFRGATLAIDDPSPLFRAAVALAVVTAFQSGVIALWLGWRDRAEIGRVLAAWRPGFAVGAMSLGGSYGWFVAFTLQTAAYVYAVGQVEVIFSVLIGALFFGERLSRREVCGMAVLMVSLVILILLA